MIHVINSKSVFKDESESHYAFHKLLDTNQFLQVHDFYEISLITKGKIIYTINNKKFELEEGSFIFIRPGDIHSKNSIKESAYINLAFPQATIDSLFDYLYDLETKKLMLKIERIPIIHLSNIDMQIIKNKLIYLNLLPLSSKNRLKTHLRTLLVEIITQYIMPAIDLLLNNKEKTVLPIWLEKAIKELEDINNLADGINFLTQNTGKSLEYICRSFKKFLFSTPTEYINTLRLNYVANMLMHSDQDIIDIVYQSGFQSLSHCYHLFKKKFNTSPLKFRQNTHIKF